MSLPIIGSKNQANKIIQRQREEDIKFHQKMRAKLVEWEIENKCLVTAILTTPQGPDYYTFHSMLNFKKLDENQVKEYRNIINEDNKKLIDKQNAGIKS